MTASTRRKISCSLAAATVCLNLTGAYAAQVTKQSPAAYPDTNMNGFPLVYMDSFEMDLCGEQRLAARFRRMLDEYYAVCATNDDRQQNVLPQLKSGGAGFETAIQKHDQDQINRFLSNMDLNLSIDCPRIRNKKSIEKIDIMISSYLDHKASWQKPCDCVDDWKWLYG
jgi:hypothetical protein